MANDLPYQRGTGDYYFPLQQNLVEGAEQIMLRGDMRNEGLIGVVIGVIKDITGIDLTDLFNTVGGWIDTGIATVKRIVDDILGIFNNLVITPINNLVQGVKDWWNGLFDWRGNTDDKVVAVEEQITQTAEVADQAALKAAANELENVRVSTEIANANLAIGTKASASEIPKNVPGYVTLNPVEDAIFPRIDLAPIPVGVTGVTSNEYVSDSFHEHTLSDAATDIAWAQPVYTTALSRYDIGYINATRDRIYNTVGFVIAAQTVASKAYMFVAIYKMERNAAGFLNGNLTRIWSSGLDKVTTIPATFPNAAQDVRIDIGQDILAAQGDWYAVVISQYGSGLTPRNLLGKRTALIGAMSGVHPTRLAMTKSGVSGEPPESLTAAELDNNSEWVPWMCLGQSVGLNKLNITDLFDRENSPVLGSNWATYGVGFDIVNGVARCKRINHGRWTNRVEDRARAQRIEQLATDAQASSIKIDAFDRSSMDVEDNPRAEVFVRSNADGTRRVTAGVRFGVLEVRCYSDANPNGITKESRTWTWAADDVIEIRASDNVTTGKTEFNAWVNGEARLLWTDLYDEAKKGVAYRRAGFMTANTHRGAVIGYLSIPSVGVNEWRGRDLV